MEAQVAQLVADKAALSAELEATKRKLLETEQAAGAAADSGDENALSEARRAVKLHADAKPLTSPFPENSAFPPKRRRSRDESAGD
eukprot:3539959-Pyramimonas_sp.AAC.1